MNGMNTHENLHSEGDYRLAWHRKQ